jgi:hypothetical protein
MPALEFLARWVDHVPERYEVRVQYAGAYATRRRVWWRRRGVELVEAPVAEEAPPEPAGDWPVLRARRRRWAELLRLVFKVEVERCPRCGGEGTRVTGEAGTGGPGGVPAETARPDARRPGSYVMRVLILKIEAALERAGVPPVALRVSPTALVFRVPNPRVEDAARALHQGMVE